MALIPPTPEQVPFDEVAELLEAAARRARGGPMAAVTGRMLATALELAGLRVVRDSCGPQLTL